MTARSTSVPLLEDGDFSSPDPLNSSQSRHDCRYATRSPSPIKLAFSSPSKRQRIGSSTTSTSPGTSRSRWTNAASPIKTVTEQTVSPWKIRVTVETEPEDMYTDAGIHAPKTIKIPLRDASSPSDERARTPRGRDSQLQTTKSQRSQIPSRKNSRSRSRRQSVTDLNITVLGDDGDSNDWIKQRSPRKKKPTTSMKAQLAKPYNIVGEKQPSTTEKTKRRSKRPTHSIEIREDTDVEDDAVNDTMVENGSPELRSIDLNHVALRSRSMSSKLRPAHTAIQDIDVPQEEADQGENVVEDDAKLVPLTRTSYPTPDPSVENDPEVNEPATIHPDDHEGFDTILESEGFTMIDLESIPSARHFYSTPSVGQRVAAPAEATADRQFRDNNVASQLPERATRSADRPTKPSAIPSYSTMLDDESDISSTVPSSPPVLSQPKRGVQDLPDAFSAKQHTPQVQSSPKLPSPPRIIHPNRDNGGGQLRESTPPMLAKVVKAGIALQGVLSPKVSNSRQATSGGTPEERLNDLFEGFDSGTRRELRAGLRFGEELAKRQRSSADAKISGLSECQPRRPVTRIDLDKICAGKHIPDTQVWQGETLVQHTPGQPFLQEDAANSSSKTQFTKKSSRSLQPLPSKKSSLCQETKITTSTAQTNANALESQTLADTQTYREVQRQFEKDVLSMEIETADSSQVLGIKIDDDDENLGGNSRGSAEVCDQSEPDELDIWCEEAVTCEQRSIDRVTKPVRGSRLDVFPAEQQQQQQIRAQNTKRLPRRSIIPRQWIGDVHVLGESSCLTDGDMTGLPCYDPKTKIKFGGAEIERQKKQLSSGSFDIDKMAGKQSEDHVLHSQASAQEICNREIVDNDAEQLQADLSMHQIQVADSTETSVVVSKENAIQLSLVEDAEIGGPEIVDTVSHLTKENTSLLSLPRAIKVPVNFNDSILSGIAPCPTSSLPSATPESSRPTTPRSALKGARQSLGLEDANSSAIRKVVFSTHEIRVGLDGQEEQTSMESVRSSPEATQIPSNGENLQPAQSGMREDPSPQTSGLLGWLWGGSKKSKSIAPSTIDSASDQELNRHTRQTSAEQILPRSKENAAQHRMPSYLLPPSYPSDPLRNTAIPMTTYGDFSDTHFRTLHILYAKSLRPRFHAPKGHEVRPDLRKLLGTAFVADETESGLGVFEWKVDEMALAVLERFMREVEWGYPAGELVVWKWSEKEICERLFRILVGEEVRKEEKAASSKSAA